MTSFKPQIEQELAEAQAFRDYFRDRVIGTFDEENRDVIAGLILGQLSDDKKKKLSDYADSSREHMLGAQLIIARYAPPSRHAWKFCVAQLKNRIDTFYERQPAAAPIFAECVAGYLSFFGLEAAQEITAHARTWEQSESALAQMRHPPAAAPGQHNL